jgi:hypothetical protein
MARTTLRGYLKMREDIEHRHAQGVAWNPETLRYDGNNGQVPDRFMELRRDKYRSMALYLRPLLLAGVLFAPNARARKRTRQLAHEYRRVFGPPPITDRLKSVGVVVTSLIELIRIRILARTNGGELVRQPRSRRVKYRTTASAGPAETASVGECMLGKEKRKCSSM